MIRPTSISERGVVDLAESVTQSALEIVAARAVNPLLP